MSRDVDRLRHVNFVLWEYFNKEELRNEGSSGALSNSNKAKRGSSGASKSFLGAS